MSMGHDIKVEDSQSAKEMAFSGLQQHVRGLRYYITSGSG
jgi:hypothetical protein